ncbi:MAG: hypothetical protein SO014_02905 [Candidatus Limivicinus sp.]|nr:hypothetical protein [Clostridiales bacterium]MDY3859577.1 hypothetical protein [Candidatus Limivicinus sp.]
MTADYYVRLVDMPRAVEGVTVPNGDGSFDIYINSRLSPLQQEETLKHELLHLEREHFYLDIPLERMERQADGEPVNIVLHPPEGMIPCFRSESALARWLRAVCLQQHVDLGF